MLIKIVHLPLAGDEMDFERVIRKHAYFVQPLEVYFYYSRGAVHGVAHRGTAELLMVLVPEIV